MWKLQTDENNKRLYSNSLTGSICYQTMVYTDKEGNKWYQFDDLLTMPETRQFGATKVSSLYALGLSKDDLFGFINRGKTLAKSNDPEKYEKIYAEFLDFQTKAENATDAARQMSSLVCVYFTINNEPIDSFGNDLQIRKMSLLEADLDMHSFFLSRQLEAIERYNQRLNLISQIATMQPKEWSEVMGSKSSEPQMQSAT